MSILVFGGTIEGRQVSDYLSSRSIPHTLCVATDYGREVLTPGPYLTIHQGRMNTEQMCEFLKQNRYQVVVDATHPYAKEVSVNIRIACEKSEIPYLRYLRPGQTETDGSSQSGIQHSIETSVDTFSSNAGYKKIYVTSTEEAARYLETQSGQIFLTTGSKELHIFTEHISDKSRLFARVLPSAQVIASCRELGLEGKQICGMQGPFSAEINEAMMRQVQAAFLVTKDTGTSGGFPEKLEAAKRLDLPVVIIRRPEETGNTWEEIVRQLEPYLTHSEPLAARKTSITNGSETGTVISEKVSAQLIPVSVDSKQRRISCIGIGMGTLDTLTHEAAAEIRQAEILFGARRILESVRSMMPLQAETVTEYDGTKIAAYLQSHPQLQRIVILMSGDVGFYSGARGIEVAFPDDDIHYYCGISSVVYFASKIPTPWQDARLLSAHGKQIALLNQVKRYPKLMLIVSGSEDVERICRELHEAGLDQVRVTVGSNLSYPEERIVRGTPETFLPCETTGLHIMLLENPQADHIVTPGIPDEAFVRGKVPMTKEEVRILSVAKLRLREDSVVYDVGAGTGSVSMEIARLCSEGRVYAIERNQEGIQLIRDNSQKLGLSNVIPVEGLAPAAMETLPAPTHAFIGGSSGNMKDIITMLRRKNPAVRIVINTIALESIAEVMTLIKELEILGADIVQITAARSRELGRYHMMTGLNPVYIISF